MTGISRGSAGGCLVSYLLGITKLDPMRYDLLFERFLNAGRVKVSLPDIDCDYPGEDRPRVKKYMEERYGWKQVCSVGKTSMIPEINKQLEALAKEKGLTYINLFPLFTEKGSNVLRADLTTDGLHLKEEGYKIWVKAIKKKI